MLEVYLLVNLFSKLYVTLCHNSHIVFDNVHPSIFLFPDDNLSNYQWTFTKLGVCIDIVETWFGIADGQISSISDRVICPRHISIFISGQ